MARDGQPTIVCSTSSHVRYRSAARKGSPSNDSIVEPLKEMDPRNLTREAQQIVVCMYVWHGWLLHRHRRRLLLPQLVLSDDLRSHGDERHSAGEVLQHGHTAPSSAP